MISLAALYLTLFGSMVQDAEGFQKLLAGYPEQVRAMLASPWAPSPPCRATTPWWSPLSFCAARCRHEHGLSILSARRGSALRLSSGQTRVPGGGCQRKLLAALTMLLATDLVYYAVA